MVKSYELWLYFRLFLAIHSSCWERDHVSSLFFSSSLKTDYQFGWGDTFEGLDFYPILTNFTAVDLYICVGRVVYN